MNGKYRILCALVILFIVWKSIHYLSSLPTREEEGEFSDVKVSVYYEALCPDSKFFITQQLLPAFEHLENFMTVDLVPYGKAQTLEVRGKVEFQCQHLEAECEANKIHACAIEHVKDPMIQLKYIACMIANNILPIDAGERCAQELKLDFSIISECASSEKGTQLLKHYGERTHSLYPPVVFIPTIELNGSQKAAKQSAILKDLQKTICQLLNGRPASCT